MSIQNWLASGLLQRLPESQLKKADRVDATWQPDSADMLFYANFLSLKIGNWKLEIRHWRWRYREWVMLARILPSFFLKMVFSWSRFRIPKVRCMIRTVSMSKKLWKQRKAAAFLTESLRMK